MLKPVLCITVVIASLAVGLYYSSRLSQRVSVLSDMISLLEEVSAKIKYTADPLAELFENNFAGFRFEVNQPFDRQFSEMVHRYKDVLSTEDLRQLDELGRDLGTSDVDSQQRMIRLSITVLMQQRDQAQTEVTNKGKLYRILPLSAGIAAAILLL